MIQETAQPIADAAAKPMTGEDIHKNIWRNSISNYISIILRMGLGLIMFRMLYQGMGKEEFGFWALLWSVFGFGILLDFGFGFTAVKRVAELSVLQKWDELSKVLSTIFYLYVVIGALIVTTVLIGSHQLIDLFRIQNPENKETFRQVLVYFFCGMGIIFPFGIFPEILIGQQRICLANVLFSLSLFLNFILLVVAMHFHWGIKAYVVIALICGFLPCFVSAIFALRGLPKVRIWPQLFSWGMVRNTMQFSIYAYVSSVSGIILAKTDQLVLSTALAVSAVAIYQAGAKVAEMFSAFAQQLPDTFSPAAAHMNATGDREFLRRLLVNGTRFSVMIATPIFFIAAFYMEGILKILTGDKIPDIQTYWVAQVLLLWGYMGLITQSVTRRIFMMCGHEKKLTMFTLGEALLNLGLSVGLVLYYKNVLCVALGSLIATLIFGWFFIWPWAARDANISGWKLARIVLFPTWLACLPLIAIALICHFTPALDYRSNTFLLIAECGVALIAGALGLWFYALTVAERQLALLKLNSAYLRFGKFFSRARTV